MSMFIKAYGSVGSKPAKCHGERYKVQTALYLLNVLHNYIITFWGDFLHYIFAEKFCYNL